MNKYRHLYFSQCKFQNDPNAGSDALLEYSCVAHCGIQELNCEASALDKAGAHQVQKLNNGNSKKPLSSFKQVGKWSTLSSVNSTQAAHVGSRYPHS